MGRNVCDQGHSASRRTGSADHRELPHVRVDFQRALSPVELDLFWLTVDAERKRGHHRGSLLVCPQFRELARESGDVEGWANLSARLPDATSHGQAACCENKKAEGVLYK